MAQQKKLQRTTDFFRMAGLQFGELAPPVEHGLERRIDIKEVMSVAMKRKLAGVLFD